MHSDTSGSDSETDLSAFNLGRRSTAWPYLGLYESEELDAKFLELKTAKEMRKQGIDDSVIRRRPERGMYRVFKVRRFLDTVKGFYTGSLDLSGRHLDRFDSISIGWKSFYEDYAQLTMVRAGHAFQLSEFERFRMRWRIPKNIFDEVQYLVNDLLAELATLPRSPNIQRLCLVHLPPEVLDMVFASASYNNFTGLKDARSLSSTCKLLREIGMPFIFRYQKLTLYSPNWYFDRWIEEGKTHDEMYQMTCLALGESRGKLMYNLAFLLSRPAIIETFNVLQVDDRLNAFLLQHEVPQSLGMPPPDFYDNIWYMLSKVLLHAVNLKTLRFFSLRLTENIMRAVVSLPQLTLLEMTNCYILQDVIDKVASGEITPSQTVLNLTIHDEEESSDGAVWDFVSFFSNLRTLSISRFGEDFEPLPRPSENILQDNNLFCTLQKLIIRPQVYPVDFIDLGQWLQSCATRAPLQLTHLKLTTRIWLEEDFIVSLLGVLRAAPLQVLVLDGVKEASFDLFDRIAANCPHLLGLTVNKRENISQRHGKLAVWPRPSWEYAACFSAFQRLEHFTWNFRINPFSEISPSSMLYMEDGFITDDTPRFITGEDSRGNAYIKFTRPEDLMDDAYSLAYPFAAHCPTLKSFAVNSGLWEQYELFCYIIRMPNGSVELRPVHDDHRPTHLLDKWDVPATRHHWPFIPKVED